MPMYFCQTRVMSPILSLSMSQLSSWVRSSVLKWMMDRSPRSLISIITSRAVSSWSGVSMSWSLLVVCAVPAGLPVGTSVERNVDGFVRIGQLPDQLGYFSMRNLEGKLLSVVSQKLDVNLFGSVPIHEHGSKSLPL